MSGHSKWHKIKRAKEVTDKKKGQIFGRLVRDIQTAARAGHDPSANAALRDAITRAKKANMPQANIDRILSGKDDADIQEVTYEAFGPGGSGLIIIASTDNPNRTVAEIRTLLKDYEATLSGPGSVRWKFNDEMKPKFSQPLSPEDIEKVRALTEALENHSDIAHVYTDTIQ